MSNETDDATAPVDAVVTLPSLAADIARCNGHIDKQVCPQRDRCIRFLVPPVNDHPRQAWFVAGSDQVVGSCTEFWST